MRVLIILLCLVLSGCGEVDYQTVLKGYEWVCLQNDEQGQCNTFINVQTAKSSANAIDFWVRSDLSGPQLYTHIQPDGTVQKATYQKAFYKLQSNCVGQQLSRPKETFFLDDKNHKVASFVELAPKFHPVSPGSTEELEMVFACKYFAYSNDKEKYTLLKMVQTNLVPQKSNVKGGKTLTETLKAFKTKAEKQAEEARKANNG